MSCPNFIEATAKRHPVEEDLSAELLFSALLGVSVKRTLTPRARDDLEGNADGAYEATAFGRGVFVLIREDKLGLAWSSLSVIILFYSTSRRIEQSQFVRREPLTLARHKPQCLRFA